ncbi:MAG: hypothetical protein A2341_19655 [Deltaproteobacteria bacterium RIFOXYB12_FULL_58_9]|nr:MAG: hypothetical protein A2341_19655 [Deltaproteobacteria bacterium RIFOXYB12_FULL_58_9]
MKRTEFIAFLVVLQLPLSCAHHTHGSSSQVTPTSVTPMTIGVSQGDQYQPLIEGPLQAFGLHSGRVVLRPGESGEVHSTEKYEELLVVIAGQGKVSFADNSNLPMSPAEFVYIPPYTTHHTSNVGSERLVYIYVVAPTDLPPPPK